MPYLHSAQKIETEFITKKSTTQQTQNHFLENYTMSSNTIPRLSTTNADDHVFPRVRYMGDGRRLSTEMRSYVTPACSKRQLEIAYAPVSVPEWMDDYHLDKTMSSLEEIHKFTFQSVLESGFDERHRPGGGQVWLDRGWVDATEAEIYAHTNTYNFKRVLREIEVRGPDIKSDKVSHRKSPLGRRLDLPIKGAHTAMPTCGGGGGRRRIACC